MASPVSCVRWLRSLVPLLLLIGAAAVGTASELAQLLARRAAPSIVQVSGRNKSQSYTHVSGVWISRVGHVLTSDHALHGAVAVTVRGHGWPKAAAARTVIRDPASRLAVLKVEDVSRAAAVQFGGFAPTPEGATYLALSCPDPTSKKKEVRASIGRLRGRVAPLAWAGVPDVEGLDTEVVALDRPFHRLVAGGPVLDEKGRFLGIANLGIRSGGEGGKGAGKTQEGLFYLVPAQELTAFLLAITDPKAEALLEKVSPGATKLLEGLGGALSKAGEGMPVAERVAFRRLVATSLRRLELADSRRTEVLREKDEAIVASLSRKGREVHREHPDWPLALVKAISERKLKKGMTTEMVKAIYGKPQKTSWDRQSDGRRALTWVYHNRRKLRGVTKARFLMFDEDRRLVKWKHERSSGGYLRKN